MKRIGNKIQHLIRRSSVQQTRGSIGCYIAKGLFFGSVSALLFACTIRPHPSNEGAWSPDGETIIFWVDWHEQYEIYSVNKDGANLHNLSDHPAEDANPVFSPDGGKIAFYSKRDGSPAGEIYVMNADGSKPRNLTKHTAHDYNPSWSPGGNLIAFQSYRDGVGQIYTMNIDGNAQARLSTSEFNDTNPAWSPNGKEIAFVSDETGAKQIFLMSARGKNRRRILNNDTTSENPKWSPDGRIIVFFTVEKLDKTEKCQIHTMISDGSNVTNLTGDLAGCAYNPFWSPNGNRIAFNYDTKSGVELRTMNADGSDVVVLARNPF